MPGIALYPGTAELLNCMHYHHDIPPLASLGEFEKGSCMMEIVNYTDPYSNKTKVRAVVIPFKIPLWRGLTVSCTCNLFTTGSLGGPRTN